MIVLKLIFIEIDIIVVSKNLEEESSYAESNISLVNPAVHCRYG